MGASGAANIIFRKEIEVPRIRSKTPEVIKEYEDQFATPYPALKEAL